MVTQVQTHNELTKKFVEQRLLSFEELTCALEKSKTTHTPLINYLVMQLKINALSIAKIVAKHFSLPLLDLDAFDFEYAPSGVINDKLIDKYMVLPLCQKKGILFIASSYPCHQQALIEIKFHSKLNAEVIIVEHDKLEKMIERYASDRQNKALGDLDDESLDKTEIDNLEDNSNDPEGTGSEVNDAPIVRFVNKIILDAIRKKASDIHFEAYEQNYRIRYRIDGILYEVSHPPQKLASRIAARIKVISKLDISERRIPQDGHFRLKLSKNSRTDFRVSSCPTIAGEKIVVRILDPSNAHIGIEKLGFEPDQQKVFFKIIKKPQGMILVTGPTGSGKTVTLYTALNMLNTPEKNISTVEDPVEMNVPGINQVNINSKTGLSFAAALRSFLRQDPDVIMVGEVRDLETAEIAIKAAQTGHLVLSTLHTNSSAETLTRLLNMGVPAYNLASCVNLIIAQRLARRLCLNCKEPLHVPKASLLEFGFTEEQCGRVTLFKPKGCEQCMNGYQGRVGLYEVLAFTPEISEIVMSGGNALDIIKQARKDGFQSLHDSGLRKVQLGLTSMEEINRVTMD